MVYDEYSAKKKKTIKDFKNTYLPSLFATRTQ